MLDTQFQALANPLRRRLLVKLLEYNPQDELSVPEDVHEGNKALEALQQDMFHIHLPRLEEAGFIKWDQSTHQVVKGPKFGEIHPLLELLTNHADELPISWP